MSRAATETGTGVRRRGLPVAVLLVGVFVSSLDLFIVNIAFPDLQRSFPSTGLADLSWVLSAYAIAFAALLMPAGRWADRSGRKRAFVCGLALFTVASAACAAAPSAGVLVAARVAQAAGGALMLPSSLGLMLPLYPAGRRGTAVGLWAAMGGAAAALGPPVGGLLVEAGWRWVFLVNLPIGVLAVVLALRTLPEIRDARGRAPNVLGASVLAATVAAVVAAIVQGQAWGWDSPRIVGLFAAGALGPAVSAWRAARHPAPVIEPAIPGIRSGPGRPGDPAVLRRVRRDDPRLDAVPHLGLAALGAARRAGDRPGPADGRAGGGARRAARRPVRAAGLGPGRQSAVRRRGRVVGAGDRCRTGLSPDRAACRDRRRHRLRAGAAEPVRGGHAGPAGPAPRHRHGDDEHVPADRAGPGRGGRRGRARRTPGRRRLPHRVVLHGGLRPRRRAHAHRRRRPPAPRRWTELCARRDERHCVT
uniref:MFS transporter n=1 Tax=Micromonospora carbonacea TaxID=47853 RepID=A0A7D6CCN8_9ACTN|nr:MFS transporter [Micromonospora carbonacea]